MLLSIPAVYVPAGETFYVDPFYDAAIDEGAGTEAEPWVFLHTGRRTEGCRIVLKSALYIDATITVAVNNVTLEGIFKEEIWIVWVRRMMNLLKRTLSYLVSSRCSI